MLELVEGPFNDPPEVSFETHIAALIFALGPSEDLYDWYLVYMPERGLN